MKDLTIFERRQKILHLLAEQPGLRVTDMAEIFHVAEGTIRNDLNALESEEKLQRVYGGAVLLSNAASKTSESGKFNAQVSHAENKQRIAKWAADTIIDGDTIFLDASSTVRFMIPYLGEFKRLVIVTNGLETASQIVRDTSHPVILVGGMVSQSGKATTSLIGLDMLKNLHIHTAYVSCVGFDIKAGLTERIIEEAQLKEAMLTSIPRVIALVGSNKIGVVSTYPFISSEQVTHFFTDSDVSAEFIDQIRDVKTNLTVCGENTVRSFMVEGERVQFTIGFANQSEELPFAIDVRRGLERAAADLGNIDLVVTDNRLSGQEALRVADKLIQRNIDLAIEYQIDYKSGSLIINKFQEAGIPVIAVDIPMVGATFFGVDNYQAGHVAGKALGDWVVEHWNGHIEQVIILEEPRAGSLPEARIHGQLDGLQEVLGTIPFEHIHPIDCCNTSAISEEAVAAILPTLSDSHHLAIISFNDEAAYGALQAARKLQREADIVIIGQGGDRLAHSEIRNPQSRLIGTTAYMPERYGEKLMELAIRILNGESVPPAVYVNHVFIDADNIDQYYPVVT